MAVYNIFSSIRKTPCKHQNRIVFNENMTFSKIFKNFENLQDFQKNKIDPMFKITQKNYLRCSKFIFRHFLRISKVSQISKI